MKIKVPEYVLKYNLNDRQLVLCSFMGYIASIGGKSVRYHIHSEDVKRILGHVKKHPTNSTKSTIEYRTFEHQDCYIDLQKIFRIGMLNYHTYRLEMINYEEHINRNGSLKFASATIQDRGAINVYYYLIGRVTGDTNIISNKEASLYDESGRSISVLEPFFYDEFGM